jgi:hypothetical protein
LRTPSGVLFNIRDPIIKTEVTNLIPEQEATTVAMQYVYKGGEAAKNLSLLLLSILQQKNRTKGHVMVKTLVQQGTPLITFPLPKEKLNQFAELARSRGVMYAIVKDKNVDKEAPSVDIIAKQNDAALLRNIFQMCGMGELPISAIVETKQIRKEEHKPGIPTAVDPEVMEELDKNPSGPLPCGRTEAETPSAERSKASAGKDKRPSVRGYIAKIQAAKAASDKTEIKLPLPDKGVPIK